MELGQFRAGSNSHILLNSILRGVRQRGLVILNPYVIPRIDPTVARLATEIMLSLVDAPTVDALAEHRPARSRFIDRHDRCHLIPCVAPSLYTSHGPVGSVSQPLPVEPRDGPHKKNQAPELLPRPDSTGAGYIRPLPSVFILPRQPSLSNCRFHFATR